MKTINLTVLLIMSLVIASCGGQVKKESKTFDKSISKIEVIDFHSTHRCLTCNAIEENTRYTLNTYFSKELQSSKISLKIINVDKIENEKISEKFEASGTSLFLNVLSKGKETQINLTEFAFMKGKNRDAFSMELKEKIETILETL